MFWNKKNRIGMQFINVNKIIRLVDKIFRNIVIIFDNYLKFATITIGR